MKITVSTIHLTISFSEEKNAKMIQPVLEPGPPVWKESILPMSYQSLAVRRKLFYVSKFACGNSLQCYTMLAVFLTNPIVACIRGQNEIFLCHPQQLSPLISLCAQWPHWFYCVSFYSVPMLLCTMYHHDSLSSSK